MKLSYVVYEPVPDFAELSARMVVLAELGYDGVEIHATHPLGFAVEDLAARAAELVSARRVAAVRLVVRGTRACPCPVPRLPSANGLSLG